jgi:shikimate kinase
MTLKLKRTPGLYLVGFMGTGKSTVGRSLADQLGWCFFDLDREIEREQGQAIARIFEKFGEPVFRDIESRLLRQRVKEIEAGNPCVMALGGGAFVQPQNWKIIEENGVTVWLDCALETIQSRLGEDETRPLAKDRAAIERLYDVRRSLYARADFRVDANCASPDDVVRQILHLPIF